MATRERLAVGIEERQVRRGGLVTPPRRTEYRAHVVLELVTEDGRVLGSQDVSGSGDRTGNFGWSEEKSVVEDEIARLRAANPDAVEWKRYVVVGLKGGDAAHARDTEVAVDLDPGNVGPVEWYALCDESLVSVLLENTGAELITGPDAWDGSRFGDGAAGTIERDEQGVWSGTLFYAPVAARLNAEVAL